MTELVQITAQYSNAVLVAIMPYISDFAHKLNLPVSNPVAQSQVAEFRCDPRKGQTGGLVILTNGFRFSFTEGHVSSYHSSKSYFSLQDPDLIPNFYGPVKMSKSEALKIARDAVKRLGYEASLFHADRQPLVSQPEKIKGNRIARYRFRWLDPDWQGPKNLGIVPALLDVEVDASNGQIEMLSLAGPALRRPSPTVAVSPPVIQRPPRKKELSGGMKTDAVGIAYATAFLEAILPQISTFAADVGLRQPEALTTNVLDLSQYYCGLLDGQPIAQLVLTNGDRFNYDHGRVVAFYAHDAYHKFPDQGRLEDFTGKPNITTNRAIGICESVIKKLGYKAKLPRAVLGNATQVGTEQVTRYVYYWFKPGEQSNFATFEIDMEDGSLKSVYLDDPSLWRAPPKLSVLPMVGTNTPAASVK